MSRPAPRKGENYELRADLNSEYRDRRKDAIKRVIANMTVGKDVSGLFPDVLKNMQTEDLEQKKLVYLYLMNYAKSQPELVILAVNTFVKDSNDPNPLVRALAIRTMGCLRAEKIIDYLSDPLHKALKDQDPYVRKTAALCVAKLYELKPELAIDNGFLEQLLDMVSDSNPMVVSNAVAALVDIHTTTLEMSDPDSRGLFELSQDILSKLLIALNECSEWGRVTILNCLARYRTTDEKEAEHICERIMPQFQHVNGSVVLAAIKAIMVHIKHVSRQQLQTQLIRKMAPPLVSLISAEPEVQWVALRNINLLLQVEPNLLQNEMRVFFCKYNDPPYVKVEKLDIMVRLAAEKNVDTLLSELKEYASEADVEFVRRAIKTIGYCAIKIEASAERCVNVLLDLIATRVSYVVQEAIVVVKDILRKYPSRYEGVIPIVCTALEELDEPEARASLVWIIGEHAEKIDNAGDLLEGFVDSFLEEAYPVQLQILAATVKLFLKKPGPSQAVVQRVLQTATKDCDSPDVRDRAYIYWRLLSLTSDAAAGKSVILAMRPPIELPRTAIPVPVLEELIRDLSSLASVYHKPAETFIGTGRIGVSGSKGLGADLEEDVERALQTVAAGRKAENLLDFDEPASGGTGQTNSLANLNITTSPAAILTSSNPLADLADIFGSDSMSLGGSSATVMSPTTAGSPNAAMSPVSAGGGGFGSLGAFGAPQQQPQPQQPQKPQQASDDLLGLF
ncbi:AP-1 complex subunit beta-1 [Rhizoctonia solani]|uniref:AP complex subunit beta n=1 Tax=Rhizoctonia solani TaxID=456999 RepID=A0A0K6GAY2_9AGAM|nr:AP-1 complex subunit beta-1 [Rhizoctonia solani]